MTFLLMNMVLSAAHIIVCLHLAVTLPVIMIHLSWHAAGIKACTCALRHASSFHASSPLLCRLRVLALEMEGYAQKHSTQVSGAAAKATPHDFRSLASYLLPALADHYPSMMVLGKLVLWLVPILLRATNKDAPQPADIETFVELYSPSPTLVSISRTFGIMLLNLVAALPSIQHPSCA